MRSGPDKNPFKGVSDLLSRASPAKRNLHFLSYIIDVVLVAVVSYLIFLGGYSITTNTDGYKKNYENYETEITYYQDMVVEAHIAQYIDRDNHVIVDDEDLSLKMAISQILLSYSYDEPSSPEFTENPLEKLKEKYTGSFYDDCFTKASFDIDYVSQFFIDYVPTHNYNNELIDLKDYSSTSYTVIFYKQHAASSDKLKFVYSTDDSEIPYLRLDVANDLYKYLVRADGYTRDAYDSFVSFYSSMLTDCEDMIFQSPSYQNTHYQDYLRYRKSITQALNTTLILSIFFGYYVAVFLPMMIFRDGRSFGKIFLRLASINVDKSETEIWKVILRSLLAASSNIYLAFFLALLPPFNGASLILYLPYLTIGSFDITLILIVIMVFVLAAINGIVMLLNHDKRSATDLLFKTVTVDVTMLDEPDYDERNDTHL